MAASTRIEHLKKISRRRNAANMNLMPQCIEQQYPRRLPRPLLLRRKEAGDLIGNAGLFDARLVSDKGAEPISVPMNPARDGHGKASFS
jgi:hypothetical protein